MLGLVCLFDGTSMKKGTNSIKKLDFFKLKDATLYNIAYTVDCINFCIKNDLFYRVSSNLIPYIDCWNWYEDSDILLALDKIKFLSSKITLTLHPDQFVVLNSDSQEVIDNSIKILKFQNILAEKIGVKFINIHLGKKKSPEKFIKTFYTLPQELQEKLTIENCHYYTVRETLNVAKFLNIPMVLDVHHARITNSSSYPIDEIIKTWKNNIPIAHISSGKNFKLDKSHSDYISEEDLHTFLWLFKLFNVEIEAKKKEKAISLVQNFLNKFM